jgi:hypothetical protein
MATTTNYGWTTPNDTDLVKDGAAAIRTLGSSVDTTTKALNPSTTLGDIEYRSSTANTNTRLGIGTTGQILSVVAGVPAWVANDVGDITEVQAGTGISVASGTGPVPVITNTVATAIDAKGDLVVGTGADTFSRLAVGTNNYVLTADSAETTGLKWAAGGGSSGPAFSAFRNTSNQTFSASTFTKVQLNAEDFDTDACFDPTTNYRFTPTTAGKYQFNVGLNIQASSTARLIVALYKNGAVLLRLFDLSVATGALVGGSALVDMNGSSDYIELYVYSEGTSPYISNRSGGAGTTLSGTWIRS